MIASPPLRWPRRPVLGALFGVLCTCAACTPLDGMNFVADRRVRIVEPERGAEVRLPLTVRLDSSLDPARRLAVIAGGRLVGPGEPFGSLVPAEDPCHAERRCSAPEVLANYGVYLGSGRSLRVDTVPRPAQGRSAELTVVLVDAAGRRQGESAWTVTVKLAVLA